MLLGIREAQTAKGVCACVCVFVCVWVWPGETVSANEGGSYVPQVPATGETGILRQLLGIRDA